MYLLGQFCQGNLTILSGRAVISTENTEPRGLLAQGHMVVVCFCQLLQAQAAASHFCVLALLGISLGHRLVLLLQHPPGFVSRTVMARRSLRSGWRDASPLLHFQCSHSSEVLWERVIPVLDRSFHPSCSHWILLTLPVQPKPFPSLVSLLTDNQHTLQASQPQAPA